MQRVHPVLRFDAKRPDRDYLGLIVNFITPSATHCLDLAIREFTILSVVDDLDLATIRNMLCGLKSLF